MHFEELIDRVQSSADWRAQKAEQYPDDRRNERSSQALRKLAENLRALPPDDEHAAAFDAAMERLTSPKGGAQPSASSSRQPAAQVTFAAERAREEGDTSVTTPSAEATGVIIETERLRMRAHRDDDLADLVALAGNWEIARWTGTIPHPYSESDGREWIARVQQDHATGQPRRFAIALKETDRPIGGVGLAGNTGDGSDEPALGYWLGQPYWGNGYAREAAAAVIDYGFLTLGLKTIRAFTDPGNTASQKVLLRCGLKNVGEIDLLAPTHHGERRAPLFRISRPELRT